MPTTTLTTPAPCISCGGKATLSIYSRIYDVEITVCKPCTEQS